MRGNSIRLRLTKSEAAQFEKTGKVEEIVEFGVAKPGLGYRLHTSADDETMRAKFEDNCLCVSVPIRDAENWINSEQVGIETVQPLGDARSLRIMVEKDFACFTDDRADEDETGSFLNPFAAGKC